jgi:hypothetical protein
MSSSGPTSNETGDEKDVVQQRHGPLTRGAPLDRSSLDEEPGVLPASNKSTSHAWKRITTPPTSLRESLRMEDAEASVLSKVEQDRARSVPMEDGFQAAVQGERAPLGAAALNKSFDQDTSQPGNGLGGQQKFAVMRVRDLQRASKSKRESLERQGGEMMSKSHHRVATLLSSIDEKKNEGSVSDARNGTGSFRVGDLGSLFDDVHHVDRLPEITHGFSEDDAQTGTATDERLPLLNSETRYDGSSPTGSTADPSMERLRQARINRTKKYWKKVSNCLNPLTIIRKACLLVFHSFLMIAIPLFAAAWILFYYLGNPEFDSLPGDARLCWWLNFFGTFISRFDRLPVHILGSYSCMFPFSFVLP